MSPQRSSFYRAQNLNRSTTVRQTKLRPISRLALNAEENRFIHRSLAVDDISLLKVTPSLPAHLRMH
jgi:hypothetical protein